MSAAPHSAMPISITHLAAGTSSWIYGIVIVALAAHITAGLVAILSGYAAVSVRKGGTLHLRLGKIFVVSMLIMAAVGAALSVPIHQPGNVGAGILAAYLVATGWLTVKSSASARQLEKAAVLMPLLVAILFFIWGLQAISRERPLYYGFAVLAALFAAIDLRMLQRAGVHGVDRIARHLWRMCFGLFFAAGSFFLGQQKVMPKFIHGSPVLWVLGLAPLGFLMFWMIRVRKPKRAGIFVPDPAIAPRRA